MTGPITPTLSVTQMADLTCRIISVRELLVDSALAIPQYQRPYKWTGRNINQLFSDVAIHKDKSSYRFGTIVLHEHNGRKDIVDGQQRTISLLLAAQFAADGRRVVCESCHCADFRGRGQRSRCLQSIIPEIPRFLGRGGVSAKKSVTPADFHEKTWYNPLEACFSPLPSTGGEVFPRHRAISTVEGG